MGKFKQKVSFRVTGGAYRPCSKCHREIKKDEQRADVRWGPMESVWCVRCAMAFLGSLESAITIAVESNA